MARYTITVHNDINRGETQVTEVPQKFFDKFSQTSQKLGNAQEKYSTLEEAYINSIALNPDADYKQNRKLLDQLVNEKTKIKGLQIDYFKLTKELKGFAINQKERPLRHEAEQLYGKIGADGKVPVKPFIRNLNLASGALIALGAAATVTSVILTGGLSLPVLFGATLLTMQSAELANAIRKDRKERKELSNEIRKEDSKVSANKVVEKKQKFQKKSSSGADLNKQNTQKLKDFSIPQNQHLKSKKTVSRTNLKNINPQRRISI